MIKKKKKKKDLFAYNTRFTIFIKSQLSNNIMHVINFPLQIKTAYMVAVLNVAFPLLIIAITLRVIHGESKKLTFVGILSAGISIAMYAAPLSSMVSFFTHSTCNL